MLPVPESHLSGVGQGNPYHAVSQFYGDYLFLDSILEDRPISPSFLDGLKAQEVVEAAKESHEKAAGCRWRDDPLRCWSVRHGAGVERVAAHASGRHALN